MAKSISNHIAKSDNIEEAHWILNLKHKFSSSKWKKNGDEFVEQSIFPQIYLEMKEMKNESLFGLNQTGFCQ